VTKFADILKIVEFFGKYPLVGVKPLDYQDFCKIAVLMKEKKHLTVSGLEEVRLIKAGMNRGRK
jgi:hypothetical protein